MKNVDIMLCFIYDIMCVCALYGLYQIQVVNNKFEAETQDPPKLLNNFNISSIPSVQ